MGLPPTVSAVYQFCFLPVLILSPVLVDVFTRRVLSCIWQWLCERIARSSAKLRSLSCVRSVHCMPMFLSDVAIIMTLSITKRNRNGDSKHPCRTPQNYRTSGQHGQTCMSCLGRCCGSGKRAFHVFYSVSVLLQCLSVHAVEFFLEVDEVDIEGDFHSSDRSILIRRLAI